MNSSKGSRDSDALPRGIPNLPATRHRPRFARSRVTLALAAALIFPSGTARGENERWTFEGSLGAAHSASTSLMVAQDDREELRFSARWKTRAFESPPYYACRIARARTASAWAVELVHHKLELDNAPPEIDGYEISHGYNLLTLNRLATPGRWLAGAGLGIVVAHPENRVRGLDLDQARGLFGLGYHLGGPVASISGGVRQRLGAGWFAGLETKLTAAYARVPVERGWSSAPNVAVHVLGTIGWGLPGTSPAAVDVRDSSDAARRHR